MTLPIVKHCYLITDINDIPRIVKEAFYIVQSGPARPGACDGFSERTFSRPKTQPVWPTLEQIKKGLRGYDAAGLEGGRHRAQ